MHGRLECVQLLLRHGAMLDVSSKAGHTPLHGAAANRHCFVVRTLVEAGASLDAQNLHGNTPLHSAAATGTVDVVSVSRIHNFFCPLISIFCRRLAAPRESETTTRVELLHFLLYSQIFGIFFGYFSTLSLVLFVISGCYHSHFTLTQTQAHTPEEHY